MKGGGREDSGGRHEVHAGPEWGVSRYSALQEAKTLALFDGSGGGMAANLFCALSCSSLWSEWPKPETRLGLNLRSSTRRDPSERRKSTRKETREKEGGEKGASRV